MIFHSYVSLPEGITCLEFVEHLGEMATLIVFPEKKRLLNPRLVVQFERFVGRSVCEVVPVGTRGMEVRSSQNAAFESTVFPNDSISP